MSNKSNQHGYIVGDNKKTNKKNNVINKLNLNDSGQLFIISAPSGTGKTTTVKQLLSFDNIEVSVSHTTRPPRAQEMDGKEYHFVDVDTFEDMIEKNLFFEYAKVFGSYYGTAKKKVEQMLFDKLDVILEIDYQGALQVMDKFPEAISIYMLPPSPEAQKERLNKRNQDADYVIANRLQQAAKEVSYYKYFDYLIVNDRFEKAVDEIKSIVTSYRLQRKRQEVLYRNIIQNFDSGINI